MHQQLLNHKIIITDRWAKITKSLLIPRQENDSGKLISFLWISGKCQSLRVFQHDSVLTVKHTLGLNQDDKLFVGEGLLSTQDLEKLEDKSVVSIVRGQVLGLKIRLFTCHVLEIDANLHSEYPSDSSLEEVLIGIFAHEVYAKNLLLKDKGQTSLTRQGITYDIVQTWKFETFSGEALDKTTKIIDLPDELEGSNEKIVKLMHPTLTRPDEFNAVGDKGVKRHSWSM